MAQRDNMTRTNGVVRIADWCEFCESHARDAAQNFAISYKSFLSEKPDYKNSPTVQDYAKKFVSYFLEHFEAIVDQMLHGRQGNQSVSQPNLNSQYGVHGEVYNPAPVLRPRSRGSTASESQLRILGTNNISERASVQVVWSNPSSFDHGDYSDRISASHNVDSNEKGAKPKSKSKRKSIFRRISFRNFKTKDKKKSSHPQNDLPSSDSTSSTSMEQSKHSHRKFKHKDHLKSMDNGINLECLKEGVIHQLVGEDYSGRTKWEKCRLTLMKTTGGYMLEFYCPPKVSIL